MKSLYPNQSENCIPQNVGTMSVPVTQKRSITTGELMGHAREILIVNSGQEYRLRLTRQDKLILTK